MTESDAKMPLSERHLEKSASKHSKYSKLVNLSTGDRVAENWVNEMAYPVESQLQ